MRLPWGEYLPMLPRSGRQGLIASRGGTKPTVTEWRARYIPQYAFCEAKQIMKQVNLLGRKALLTVDPFRFIRSDKIIKMHAANISAVSRKLPHIALRFAICLKASLGFGA